MTITAVRVPDVADEAVRDLVRAREDAVRECRNARHRLEAPLLRNGVGYAGKPAPYQCRPDVRSGRLPPVPTSDSEPSDDSLMAAYAAGDSAAFERLYARHQAGLYRFIRRLLGGALNAQADEVFQDTWLRVVHARSRWQPQGATFRTWLLTLAHHRVIDLLRRSGREVSIDAIEADGGEPWEPATASAAWQHWPAPASAAPHGDELAFWRRAGEKLLACLEQLPLPQRSAFLLHHGDGLALDEVANALEVGFETAKTRLRYARAKLRTCMGAYLAPLSPTSTSSSR